MNYWRVGEEETQVSAKHLPRRFDSGTRLIFFWKHAGAVYRASLEN